ncbi:hypothetical protein B0H10DRAFT_2225823 [Mycena sp. CBHHK59/15]|nr:hypothetical protein B0H10DRAFT_2225823 [Mycena sp. CBHHK59/15]
MAASGKADEEDRAFRDEQRAGAAAGMQDLIKDTMAKFSLSPCNTGYKFKKTKTGYQCIGGGHSVTFEQLRMAATAQSGMEKPIVASTPDTADEGMQDLIKHTMYAKNWEALGDADGVRKQHAQRPRFSSSSLMASGPYYGANQAFYAPDYNYYPGYAYSNGYYDRGHSGYDDNRGYSYDDNRGYGYDESRGYGYNYYGGYGDGPYDTAPAPPPRPRPRTPTPPPTAPSEEYLATSLAPQPAVVPPGQRKLAIFDLNGTLLLRSAHAGPGRPRMVHLRPYARALVAFAAHPDVQGWLDCMVWSSAQAHNVHEMVGCVFGAGEADGKGQVLRAVWARDTLGLGREAFSAIVLPALIPPSLTRTPFFFLPSSRSSHLYYVPHLRAVLVLPRPSPPIPLPLPPVLSPHATERSSSSIPCVRYPLLPNLPSSTCSYSSPALLFAPILPCLISLFHSSGSACPLLNPSLIASPAAIPHVPSYSISLRFHSLAAWELPPSIPPLVLPPPTSSTTPAYIFPFVFSFARTSSTSAPALCPSLPVVSRIRLRCCPLRPLLIGASSVVLPAPLPLPLPLLARPVPSRPRPSLTSLSPHRHAVRPLVPALSPVQAPHLRARPSSARCIRTPLSSHRTSSSISVLHLLTSSPLHPAHASSYQKTQTTKDLAKPWAFFAVPPPPPSPSPAVSQPGGAHADADPTQLANDDVKQDEQKHDTGSPPYSPTLNDTHDTPPYSPTLAGGGDGSTCALGAEGPSASPPPPASRADVSAGSASTSFAAGLASTSALPLAGSTPPLTEGAPTIPRFRHSAHTTLLVDDSPMKARLQLWNHLCVREYGARGRARDLRALKRGAVAGASTSAAAGAEALDAEAGEGGTQVAVGDVGPSKHGRAGKRLRAELDELAAEADSHVDGVPAEAETAGVEGEAVGRRTGKKARWRTRKRGLEGQAGEGVEGGGNGEGGEGNTAGESTQAQNQEVAESAADGEVPAPAPVPQTQGVSKRAKRRERKRARLAEAGEGTAAGEGAGDVGAGDARLGGDDASATVAPAEETADVPHLPSPLSTSSAVVQGKRKRTQEGEEDSSTRVVAVEDIETAGEMQDAGAGARKRRRGAKLDHTHADEQDADADADEPYDPTLLALIGVLAHVRRVGNVAAWMRGGGLVGEVVEGVLADAQDGDAMDAPSVPPPSSFPPAPSSSFPLLPRHDPAQWFASRRVLHAWAVRGRAALTELGIEAAPGIA